MVVSPRRSVICPAGRLNRGPSAPTIAAMVIRRHTCLASLVGLVLLIAVAAPGPVAAFSVKAHRQITRLALEGKIETGTVAPANEADLVKFFTWLGKAMAMGGDPAGQAAFRARFKAPSDFNARGVRQFLGMTEDPEVRIYGITRVEHKKRLERLALLIAASAYPDLDGRNRRCLLFSKAGAPEKLEDGRFVPFDPMALNMGGPEGLASQAHAHYALPGVLTPTDDPEVLRNEPWRFVVAPAWDGPVETYADEMAQLHLDMAILARAWGDETYLAAADYLAMVWLGAGLHYIQDASGPLHNVQVGSYQLFARAKKAWYLRALLTGGGFFADLPSFITMGIHLLSNHHLLGERWLATQLDAAARGDKADLRIATVLATLDTDDPHLSTVLERTLTPYLPGPNRWQPWEDGRGAGNVIVEALAKLGARDGGALYDAIAAIAAPKISDMGYDLPEDGTVTDDLFRDPTEPEVAAAMDSMTQIQANSLRRALLASRRYVEAWRMGNADIAARRLQRSRGLYLAAADSRREAWLRAPPDAAGDSTYEPMWFAISFALILLLTAAIVRIVRLARARPRAVVATARKGDL